MNISICRRQLNRRKSEIVPKENRRRGVRRVQAIGCRQVRAGDVRNEVIYFEVEKNNRRMHKELAIPILPALEDGLAASKLGTTTFLRTE